MKSTSKSILISLTLTIITLLIISNFQINPNHTSNSTDTIKRRLISQTEYTDLCVNKTFSNFTLNISAFSGFTAYLNNLSYVDLSQKDNIKKTFIDDDTQARTSLLIALFAKYIVFLAFALVTIIFWIGYCVCCCKPCLCCKGSKEESKLGVRNIFFILFIISFFGVIVVCIIGFVFSGRISEKIDSAQCSLLKFYLDIKDGEVKSTTPKWVGIENILQKFQGVEKSLDNVKANSNSIQDTSYVSNDRSAYQSILSNSYNTASTKRVRSPLPSGNQQFSPGFIENYGPVSTSNSTTGLLIQEFDLLIVGSSKMMTELKSDSLAISNNIDAAKVVLQSSMNQLRPLSQSITKLDEDYISKIVDFRKNSTNSLNQTFIGLFASLIILAFIFFVFVSMFICFEIKFAKYISHIVWNLITLITIPIFIIGAVFGLLGTAFSFIGPILEVLFSKEGLNKIFTNSTSTIDIIDTCVNKNGDLTNVVAGSSGLITNLNNLISYGLQLDQVSNNLTSADGSPLVKVFQKYYTDVDKNIALDTSTSSESAKSALFELSLYTDYTEKSNSKQASCSSNTYDFYVSSDDSCPDSYKLIQSSSSTENIGSKSCLNIRNWSSNLASSRYSDRPKCDSLNIQQTVSNYVTSITNYATDASGVLTYLQSEMNTINSSFKSSSNKIKDAINNAKNLYSQTIDIVRNEVGSNGKLFDIINCSFIGSNMAIIVDIFQNSGKDVVQIGACLCALALINWLVLFFGYVVLMRKITADKSDGQTLVK